MTMPRPNGNDPEPGYNNAIRTPFLLREPRRVSQSTATICMCGGHLAECDNGRVWCLVCEKDECND